ncbi:hypothetical protein C0995_002505 [Termitomyces sp. Mi166|nr:hypothetical protein C0995_002505 [Termitomyces sp. Mi166\
MPVSEGHALVIPKYHGETLKEVPDEYLADIGPVVRKVALATGVKDFNIIQHIPHVHFHVVPKPNENEGLVLDAKNWPMKKGESDALAATAVKMKSRI